MTDGNDAITAAPEVVTLPRVRALPNAPEAP
jgi:hypothetical protein